LQEAKKLTAIDNEDYVYLPPGSSMQDPGYNSMSDPLDKRVMYYDANDAGHGR
jgi:hypothetical protein